MKVAIVAPYARLQPHFETDLEFAQRHLDQGHEVVVLTCDASLPTCDWNVSHDRKLCLKCMGRRDAGLRLLKGRFRHETMFALNEQDLRELQALEVEFDDLESLKSFCIDDFDIGYAVVSSLVSEFRDPDVDLRCHQPLLRQMVRSAWMSYRSMVRRLADERFDRVYVFNGRLAPLRAVLRACQQAGVTCLTHDRGRDTSHFATFENALPHDLDYLETRIRESWQTAADDPRRDEIGHEWYLNRARGVETRWHSYVSNQQSRRLPESWDPNRRNVVIFPSSEDECVAIGESWNNALFPSQLSGLQFLIDTLRDDPSDLHLYLRMHPNLADIRNERTLGMYRLAAPFLTIINPRDPVDTYALMRQSEKVISFGSTAGIEAVYFGTPSVLLGPCPYRNLGGTYNVTSREEVGAIVRARLQPRSIEGALSYGHFWATLGEPYQYFEPADLFRGTFKGKKIRPGQITRIRILWHRAVSHFRKAA